MKVKATLPREEREVEVALTRDTWPDVLLEIAAGLAAEPVALTAAGRDGARAIVDKELATLRRLVNERQEALTGAREKVREQRLEIARLEGLLAQAGTVVYPVTAPIAPPAVEEAAEAAEEVAPPQVPQSPAEERPAWRPKLGEGVRITWRGRDDQGRNHHSTRGTIKGFFGDDWYEVKPGGHGTTVRIHLRDLRPRFHGDSTNERVPKQTMSEALLAALAGRQMTTPELLGILAPQGFKSRDGSELSPRRLDSLLFNLRSKGVRRIGPANWELPA